MMKNKKTKNVVKKKTRKLKKGVSKKVQGKPTTQELVIRVAPQVVTPTLENLVEPMKDGKKMALTQTWVSAAQLIKMVGRTPVEHVYTRPGKGGQKFSYVTGNYVTKVLNFVFGWNWDFEVIAHGKEGGQVWVQGKLTVKSPKGETITKTQFGRADIKTLKSTKEMLDFGNDLKSATTDALKKCASMLGIASDIYGKMEYKQEANVEVKEEATVQLGESVVGPDGDPTFVCSKCDAIVDEAVAGFSKKMFGKVLCREDQANAKRK